MQKGIYMQTYDAYILDCRERGLKANTLRTYELRVKPALPILNSENKRLSLIDWLDTFPNARTKHQIFRSLKTYVRWCVQRGHGDDWISGMKLKFADAPVPRPLSHDQFKAILEAIPRSCKRKDHALAAQRDRALFSVLFYSGARRDAIRLLRWKEIDLSDMTIQIKTKGDKEFLLPIARQAAPELEAWKSQCPSGEWAFPSIRRPAYPICQDHVSHTLPRYAKKAGITRRVWVHLLRHSHAGALADADISLEVIQVALGHSSITTTMKYVSLLRGHERVRKAISVAFG